MITATAIRGQFTRILHTRTRAIPIPTIRVTTIRTIGTGNGASIAVAGIGIGADTAGITAAGTMVVGAKRLTVDRVAAIAEVGVPSTTAEVLRGATDLSTSFFPTAITDSWARRSSQQRRASLGQSSERPSIWGRSGAGLGDTLDAAPRSAWSGRIVIAKPVDPTRRRSTKCQLRGRAYLELEARRSARPHHRYKLTPKSCPTRAGRLKVAGVAVIPLDANPPPMVKRPLTRITYPVGLSARFGPPLTTVRVTSPPYRGTSDCLGHIRANSQHNHALGSGGQGPAARDRGGVFLPAGQGRGWKARQAEQGRKDGDRLSVGDFNEAGVPAQTTIFVPRHPLAEELRGVIEHGFRERGEQITVPILRGRENGGEEGNAPCRRWREARELARKRLPIYTNLCQRKSDGQSSQCPYFAGCEYIQTRQAAYCSPFVILVHSHLGLEWGATAAERFYQEEDDEGGRERQRHFNPKQANIIVCDEDPTFSLVEEAKLSPEDIRGLGEDGLGETILAGLIHPGGLLSHLRDQGIPADQLRQAAEGARAAERSRGQISNPDGGDGELAQAANTASRLSKDQDRGGL
jgi:hypothetical protein